MLLVIPAMELRNGHCARQIKGAPGTEGLYTSMSDCPDQLAKLWRRENSKTVHITDADGLELKDNSANIEAILETVKAVDIPVQLVSAFTTLEECKFWLDSGIYRIILSILPRTNPDAVRELIEKYTPSKVVAGIRLENGKIFHPGLDPITDHEYAQLAKDLGIRRLVYADTAWEGRLTGPDLTQLRKIAVESGLRITAAGGIASPQHLWALQELEPVGVDSVIIGRALFENLFPCQQLWRLVEAELEPDLIQNR